MLSAECRAPRSLAARQLRNEPSLELLGLDAVLAATTFAGADAALSRARVLRSFFERHRRQDRETGAPRSAARNTPPTDDLERLTQAKPAYFIRMGRAEDCSRWHYSLPTANHQGSQWPQHGT